MPEQSAIKCVIMRGGTSKGVFFDEKVLPADAKERERLVLSLMGSPTHVRSMASAAPIL